MHAPSGRFLKMGAPQNHRFQYKNGLILDTVKCVPGTVMLLEINLLYQ